MPAPRGLGWYVAFERTIAPGGKAEDLRVAVERCLDTGATWVALRAGVDGANDADLSAESIAAFRAAGIKVYVWIYLRSRAAAVRTLAGFKKWIDAGVDGVWIDAEFDYDGGAEDVRTLVLSIRAAGCDFVGHAPPDYLGAGLLNGGKVPAYLEELDRVCDMIAPQVYAWEHDDRGHVFHLDRVCAGYAKRGYGPEKVAPIGAPYRPKMRGGRPTPSMPSEAACVAADILAFLEHPAVKASPCPSFYSLDAISWINGPSDRVIATLAERASRLKDTDPAPAPSLDDGPSSVPTVPGISPEAVERRRSSPKVPKVDAPIIEGGATIDADDGTRPIGHAGEGERTP